MNKEKLLKRAELHNSLYIFAIIVAIVFFVVLLQSCNTEKKALKPYKQVLADVDTFYKEKKDILIDAIVDAKRPNKAKSESETKYLPGKPIYVKDTAGLLKLANFYERKYKGKQCFTGFELDSMINDAINEIEPTTIYVTDTLFKSKKETILDTTGNRKKAKEFEGLTQKLILTETNLHACNIDYNNAVAKLKANENSQSDLSYSFKLFIANFWHKFKWWIILLLVSGIAYKYLKNKINLIGFLKDRI